MCGISGIINKDAEERIDADLLKNMCSVIKHRGPDDYGVCIKRNAAIGMRRLSIIDIKGGSQPIHNEDKSVWIVFNGEIYNYQDLRNDLIRRGHEFYTASDTETIVHLYEDFGEDCVHHLRGMFAFAIWDQKRDKILLARDRLGIKPLFYMDDGKRFLFGSEIKSILTVPNIPREVHSPSLINYFAYGYVPDPDTIFKGIYKLPPGHHLVYEKEKIRINRYWDLHFNYENPQPEEYYIEGIHNLLSEAVKIRLMSEVPLGAFLSGGIDSSAVVGLMAQHMTEPVKTFSIGFENTDYSELKYAKIIAERFGTDHHEEIVKPDVESVITKLIRQFDEPFADSSAIPTYYVSKMTRKYVTVALSGDGGDELFGGYNRYLDGPPAKYTRWIPEKYRRLIFLNTSKILPEWFPGINTLRYVSCNDDTRYVRKLSKGISTVYHSIFSNELCRSLLTTDPSPIMLNYLNSRKKKDSLTRRQYLDTKTYLPADILTKVDRTSMLVSLEARIPILDHKLVEFVANIPPEFKIRRQIKKYIFKKTVEKLLPKEILYRPKMGFQLPIAEWINNEWGELSYEIIFGERALKRKNFNEKFLRRIWSEHKRKRRNHSRFIWSLMVLELWYREFIDG